MTCRRKTLGELYRELDSFKADVLNARSDAERDAAKKQVQRLQSRIANRERYQAMRDLGLTKTPWGWE